MLYTVSEAYDAHVYAWLVMCPRTVIDDITIQNNLGVRACPCMRVRMCVRACVRACEHSLYYKLYNHHETKTIVIALDTISHLHG